MITTASRAFTGVIPILATPFHDDESLDLDSLERLVRFNVSAGVDAITVLGPVGEESRLTDAERSRVIDCAVSAAVTVPVIVGIAHAGTAATIALSQQALELGATAIMVTPVVRTAAADGAVVEYVRRIAQAVAAPIVVQANPAGAPLAISVELLVRLAREIPAIASISVAAPLTAEQFAAFRSGMSDRCVTVLTGLDALCGPFDLEIGADGFHTAFTFPEILLAVLKEFRSHSRSEARRIFTTYLPLIAFEHHRGVAIRKEILRRRGVLESNRVRDPGTTIDAQANDQLTELLSAIFGGGDIPRRLEVSVPRPFIVNI